MNLINVVSVTDCRRHHASHAHVQVCLIFSVVFWNYNVCMFGLFFFLMSTFHCWGNFILKTLFYSTFFLFQQFRETMHFLPCATFIENRSNRSSGVQIPWDICTRFGCYLYSTEWSWTITMDINNLLGALVAEKKKGEGFFFNTILKEQNVWRR